MVATNLIALLYPPGAAGKTIATAMGLSTDAVLLDSYTASQNLTSGEKFNFLESSIREYLNSNNSKWHDINLGNKNLFGESVRSAIVNKHPIHNYENSDLIEKLIQDNKFFFYYVT